MKVFRCLLVCLSLVVMFPLQHCDKNELTELEKLPAATQAGKNTFGCLVNGKAWYTFNYNNTHSVYQLGHLSISANVFNPLQSIGFDLFENNNLDPISTGVYDLVSTSNYDPWVSFYSPSTCSYGMGSADKVDTMHGTVTITRFDKQNYIISGTFEFTLSHQGCETLKVTNGRFDMDYAP